MPFKTLLLVASFCLPSRIPYAVGPEEAPKGQRVPGQRGRGKSRGKVRWALG